MRRSRIAGAVVLIGLLAASAALAANARKVPQAGGVKGDAQASVRLVVITKSGAPKSVKNLRFKDLLFSCPDGPARVRMRLYGGAARVNAKRKFMKTYGDGNSRIQLKGKVRRDGSRVHASINGTTVRIAGVGRCDVPKIEFTTMR